MLGNFEGLAGMTDLRRLAAGALFLLAAVMPANASIIFVPIAGQPPTLPPEKAADYGMGRTVAVISVLGDHMTLRNSHFMGPKDKQMDIREWNLDTAIEAKLKQYLSGRFTFKEVVFDDAALAKIPNGPWDNSAKYIDFAKTLPVDGLDDFLVVRPDLVMQVPGMEGLALESGGAFSYATPVIWANYEIDLIDARTGTLIATAYSRARLRNGQVAFSGIAGPPEPKAGDDFQFTPEQTALLRCTVESIVSVSLVETLRALNMGDNLPPTGTRTMIPNSARSESLQEL